MRLCSEPVRGGGTCALGAEHRRGHSTVAFVCEGCGERRRGRAHRVEEVRVAGEVEDRMEFCFLCVPEEDR